MYCFRFLFYFNVCISGVYSKSNKVDGKALRIIGGRAAAPGEFPYVLKIGVRVDFNASLTLNFHICTGSLLTSTWSLTAAHCLPSIKSPLAKAVIAYNFTSTGEASYSNILSSLAHPNYFSTRTCSKNDIGLIRSDKVAISDFAKLSPVDHVTLYGSKIISLGYGVTIGNKGEFGDALSVNKSLQVFEAIVTKCIKSETCWYPSFCLGGVCNKWSTLCPGDSGGPVIHSSGLIGINSAIRAKCEDQLPESYKFKTYSGMIAPVCSYIDWVRKIIQ